MGYSKIGFFAFITLVNVVIMIQKTIEQAKRQRKLAKLKADYTKALEA